MRGEHRTHASVALYDVEDAGRYTGFGINLSEFQSDSGVISLGLKIIVTGRERRRRLPARDLDRTPRAPAHTPNGSRRV